MCVYECANTLVSVVDLIPYTIAICLRDCTHNALILRVNAKLVREFAGIVIGVSYDAHGYSIHADMTGTIDLGS